MKSSFPSGYRVHSQWNNSRNAWNEVTVLSIVFPRSDLCMKYESNDEIIVALNALWWSTTKTAKYWRSVSLPASLLQGATLVNKGGFCKKKKKQNFFTTGLIDRCITLSAKRIYPRPFIYPNFLLVLLDLLCPQYTLKKKLGIRYRLWCMTNEAWN